MDGPKSVVTHLANLAIILCLGVVYVVALAAGTVIKRAKAAVVQLVTLALRFLDRRSETRKPAR